MSGVSHKLPKVPGGSISNPRLIGDVREFYECHLQVVGGQSKLNCVTKFSESDFPGTSPDVLGRIFLALSQLCS